ncbi:MAG: hypothetical protein IKH95_01370 [Bacteroidaceae bacterium]|nr:hypothetical protein [Bacteroidaceae bacterium]
MNRIFYSFIIAASLFTLAACSGKAEKTTVTETDSISGTLLSDSLIFSSNCNHIFTVGNKLFLSNADPVEDCAYRVVDLESKQFIDKFGLFGGGPGEFRNQKYAGKTMDNDTIYAYDISRRKIQVLSRKERTKTYQYSHTLPVKTNDNSIFTILRRLENGYYVGVPYSGKYPFFVLLDALGQEAGRFGKLPVIGEYNEVMDLKRLEGNLETSGNSVYYGTDHFGYLVRYDVNDKGEATLIWEKYLSEPQYRMEDGRIKLNRRKNLEGFSGLTAVGNYVLATYSGKLYSSPFAEDPDAHLPQTLIIFRKEDGKILRRLHLDRRGTFLTAIEDGKTLIMKTYNPEVTYCLYDLEKILKNLN